MCQDRQRLVRMRRRRGILRVIYCLWLNSESKSETARSQQRAAGILKRQYASLHPDTRVRLRLQADEALKERAACVP